MNGPLLGTDEFIRQVVKRSAGALWNNGSYVNRPKRGHPGSISNHSRGLAIDFSYRQSAGKGLPNGRALGLTFLNSMIANADALGLELVIDYFDKPFGRSWRCDRAKWKQATVKTFTGAPGGDWFHVEIALDKALFPHAVTLAFTAVYDISTNPV